MTQPIQPYTPNPFYWQYNGQPVLLLGGSVEDNLFQIDNLEAHLDLLAACGGNYVRCTMSSRDEGDVWPFARTASGPYDLEQLSPHYWEKFATFLRLTADRAIIVQIEVWDRFDFARDPWQLNPFNARNNINYSAAEVGIPETITTHPGRRESGFFRSVPALENNELLLGYQHKFVDALLEHTLPHNHVLYCMDNETNESPEWPRYWATYLQERAAGQGKTLQLTEMWDAHDLADPQHRHTVDHPELYAFVDISQNNHQSGWTHWQNMQRFREDILASGTIRPINTVKIYGANTGRYGRGRDAQERFWRNIFGGLASTRFHRPPAGIGLSQRAQAHIRSLRMLTDRMDVFRCAPHMELLQEFSRNEAYCFANPGAEYAVFFTDGGHVRLDVSGDDGPLTVTWLDIVNSVWLSPEPATPTDSLLTLETPQPEGYWAVLIQ